MPKHSVQKTLSYTPKQIFDLVADIEEYPEFLPWCAAARIIKRNDNVLTADLVIKFKAFQEKYTSSVTMQEPEGNTAGTVDVSMLKGPFRRLDNNWKFSPCDGGCLVDFSIDFQFKNPLLETMIGFMFEKAFAKMVDAFEERAEAL